MPTRASVDHDCQIGKHAHIAQGVTLSGGVFVGDETLVGMGSSVIMKLPDNCKGYGSCALNYKVFVLMYKLAEFVLVAMASVKERQISDMDIVRFCSDFSNRVDYNVQYMDEMVAATSKQSTGVADLMKALLDAE